MVLHRDVIRDRDAGAAHTKRTGADDGGVLGRGGGGEGEEGGGKGVTHGCSVKRMLNGTPGI